MAKVGSPKNLFKTKNLLVLEESVTSRLRQEDHDLKVNLVSKLGTYLKYF